jgi:hypothetical protein
METISLPTFFASDKITIFFPNDVIHTLSVVQPLIKYLIIVEDPLSTEGVAIELRYRWRGWSHRPCEYSSVGLFPTKVLM